MQEARRFVDWALLVAHNASFDQPFWNSEHGWVRVDGGAGAEHSFACTVLLSRKMHPGVGSYRLGALAELHALPTAGGGRAHRAMADAEVAAALLARSNRMCGGSIRRRSRTGCW
ncbi:MAG: exonuclease domain-containing protein [Ramlibacter sp.]